MRQVIFLSYLFLFISIIDYAQSKISCSEIKDGTFFSYPKNSPDRYFSVRDGDVQTEANLVNGDTTVWQVKWLNDCTYSLSFTSGANTASKEVINLLKKHKLVYQIHNVTDDYYIFSGHLDKVKNPAFETDTMWLHEKSTYTDNTLYTYITDPTLPRKEHFSDTSRYALLYVYRPGKLTNSLGSYMVYCNDNLLCVAQNNTGYLFKIYKEGKLHLSSRLFKDESSVDVDIQLGKKYYVKSMIHWGLSKRLYNFKLEMANVSQQTGEMEFNEVKVR